RQLGGSIGIALITTYISIDTTKHYSYLSENITATDPATQERVKMLTNSFMGKGFDIQSATANAYGLISKSVFGQATFLTYEDLFIYLGLFFLMLIPLLIMFRNKKKKVAVAEEIAEWTME
ncbi:MAG: MFS transporter, partial [Bacteroidota bacterium]|nr:MFS transporter [Bacteroidota bacterium]